MKQRIISALVGVVLLVSVYAMSIMLEPTVMCFALALVALIGVYEALNVIGTLKNPSVSIPCFAYTIVVELAFLFGKDFAVVILAATIVFGCFVFISMLRSFEKMPINQVAMAVFITAIIVFSIFAAIKLYLHNADYMIGVAMLTYCLVAPWLTDIGAYFVGSFLGKHKLTPKISPKKTIEGAIGGLFVSVALSWAIAHLCVNVFGFIGSYTLNIANFIITTLICSIMSMIGDLSFSVIKRTYNVKDYGNIMPGHGGVLDRFDSVLFVCPVVYLLNFWLPIFTRI